MDHLKRQGYLFGYKGDHAEKLGLDPCSLEVVQRTFEEWGNSVQGLEITDASGKKWYGVPLSFRLPTGEVKTVGWDYYENISDIKYNLTGKDKAQAMQTLAPVVAGLTGVVTANGLAKIGTAGQVQRGAFTIPIKPTCPAPAGRPLSSFADEAAQIQSNAAASRALTPNATRAAMRTADVELFKLSPPSSRPFADPAKLERMGPFDWSKYEPIWVQEEGGRLVIIDGMTRVEAALRAGITKLPAYIFKD